MKLRFQFTVMDMGNGEFAATAVGEDADKFHGMIKLNAVAADIFQQFQEDTTPEKVHAYLKGKYPESTDDEIGQTVVGVLNDLAHAGLLINC